MSKKLTFLVDFNKVKTVKQMAMVFNALQLTIESDDEGMLDEKFREIFEKGFMVSVNREEVPIEEL